jgi:4-hydroxyproline epimerase
VQTIADEPLPLSGMRTVFECVDGHTCGNPVRVVKTGKPELPGASMSEKRTHFIRHHDWIRKGLMFEPRGHDMMSGSLIYPPHDPANDAAILFIETSGCLPMCGHGTIGTVTIAIEEGLIIPHTPGIVRLEVPAGRIDARYTHEHGKVRSVTLTNVPSFLAVRDLKVHVGGLGEIAVDVAYGGNYYAIVDVQPNFPGIEHFPADRLISMGRELRNAVNAVQAFVHPQDPSINGCSHVLWTGKPMHASSTARGAVIYGEKAIDRSPCGTGTSARLAQWHALGRISTGEPFIHESIIGSTFTGMVVAETEVGGIPAIVPSIEGWARVTGYNTIIIDDEDDPYAHGFQVL